VSDMVKDLLGELKFNRLGVMMVEQKSTGL